VSPPTAPGHLAATRAAYDAVAADYADLLRDELEGRPLDRALLAAFAELVQTAGGGPVAEAGCGPGRVTAHLAGLGLQISGVDLSPGMLAVARRAHPGLPFTEGRLDALPLASGALAGLVAWYSVIHTPPARLGDVFSEFSRVLRPGAELLLAFQAADGKIHEKVHLSHAYGHTISLDAYRLAPARIEALLTAAGLVTHTRMLRDPGPGKKTPQAYLLARRVMTGGAGNGSAAEVRGAGGARAEEELDPVAGGVAEDGAGGRGQRDRAGLIGVTPAGRRVALAVAERAGGLVPAAVDHRPVNAAVGVQGVGLG
jgi:SAM-dependent methyltransferase